MKDSIIAVVTPVFNAEVTIKNSIDSLKSQTIDNWINIIVNDGSTDQTREILNEYKNDERFIIINLTKNVGRGVARKIALNKVLEIGAKYMCMLDADDIYYPDKLQWQFDYMQIHPEIALASCSIGYIDTKNNLKGVLEISESEQEFMYNSYYEYKQVPHACSIIRVASINGVTFNEEMLLGQDQDFMVRMLLGKRYSYLPRIGYLYNREDSFSFKKYKKAQALGYYSKSKLGYSRIRLVKLYISTKLKILIVGILAIVGRQNLYFSQIGRLPTENELKLHREKLSL